MKSTFKASKRRVAFQRKALSAWNRKNQAIVPFGPKMFMYKMNDPLYWNGDEPCVEVERRTLIGFRKKNYHDIGKFPGKCRKKLRKFHEVSEGSRQRDSRR